MTLTEQLEASIAHVNAQKAATVKESLTVENAARLFVIPTEDAETARFIGRRMITSYLTVPVYAEFHRWLGRSEQLQPMWDAWAAGDRKLANAVA